MQGVERQPVRKKYKAIMILFGSTLGLIASFCAWPKSRKFVCFVVSKIIIQVKYQVLGFKAILCDIRDAKYNKTDLPRKSGSIAVITGGSRGIAVEVVRMLMKCDMEIIIACRNPTAGENLIKQIRESGVEDGKAKVYQLDNSSLESVRKFAESVKRDYKKIDVLINNAGMMFPPWGETKDGFEQQWGTNYLSHFLLTSLLMPLLKNAGTPNQCARIINVSSCAHELGIINFDDINYKNKFITGAAYAQSKLAAVMFTKSLQQLLTEKNLNVRCYAIHPGIVDTDLFENTSFRKVKFLTRLLFKNPVQGAVTTVYTAVSKDIEGRGGIYISNCRESPVNPLVNDLSTRERLFKLSLEQVKLKDFFEYL